MANTAAPVGSLPPDEDVGPVLLILSAVLIFFATVTAALRIYVRVRNRMLGWDDYTMMVALAFGITRYGCEIGQAKHGNGRHRVYIDPQDYVLLNMYGWLAQIFLFASICVLKISICLLILRIKDSRWLRSLLFGVMAGLVLTNGGVIVILLAECSPVEAYWTGVGWCWESKVRIYSIYCTIAYSILTDLLCSMLPLVVVWKVCIPWRTKLSVCGLMSLGLLATGFGIARASSLGLATNDLSWVYCIAAIWSNLELFLGITAANLALSRSVYVYFFGDGDSQTSRSHGISSHHSHPSRSGYLPTKLRGDRFEPPNTIVESRPPQQRNRRGSASGQSMDSDIPLEPGIKKKTEFWLSEEGEPDGVRQVAVSAERLQNDQPLPHVK